MFLVVWCIYLSDRLVDVARCRDWSRATGRLRFGRDYRWLFLVCLAVGAACLIDVLFWRGLPRDVWRRGVVVAFGMLLHILLFITPILPRKLPGKEFGVGIFFALGAFACLGATARSLPLLISIALVVAFNCLVIAARDADSDRLNDGGAASNWWPTLARDLAIGGVLLTITAVALAMFSVDQLFYIALATAFALLTLLHRAAQQFCGDAVRALADFALFTPLVIFGLTYGGLPMRILLLASAIFLFTVSFLCAAEKDELWKQLEPFTKPPAEFAGKLGDYRSPLLFADGSRVETKEVWQKRRAEILQQWHERLGPWPPLLEKPVLKKLETVEKDGYTQQHVNVQISADGKQADGYLLTPNGAGPFPAVFVPFYEPQTSIGEGKKGQGTHDYGLQLVKRGFVTLSIGTPGSFENIGVETRELLTQAGKEQRRQPLTLLAYVAANCHTALAQLPNVDPKRIGVIGLSYGGKWSMFASCLHEPFACAVWSDPGIVFNEKNSNVNYWEPWYLGYDPQTTRKPGVPSADNPRTGLYKRMADAHEDLVDLHALMAPRPVLVSGGTEDPPRNWQPLQHLIAVNQLLGAENRVAMTARKGHIPTTEALELELAFLEYWLK